VDDQRIQQYATLLYFLQSEPQHLVVLLQLARPPVLDRLVLTIMNSIFGSTQPGDDHGVETAHLLKMMRMVLSQSLDVGEDRRSVYWRGDVAGRILGAYARRRSCQLYITSTLGAYVERIVQHELLNLEIDPVKVYDQIVDQMRKMHNGSLPSDVVEGVTPLEAAADPGVQSIVKQRLMMLIEVATNILISVIGDVEAVPTEIRSLCELIRDVCKENHPEMSSEGICSLLGEFVFKRLVIPALLRPNAHGLVNKAPSKNPSRTLALVSKMLQYTVQSSGQEEAYMETLITEFSDINTNRVTDFLLRVCESQAPGAAKNNTTPLATNSLCVRIDALYQLHALLIDCNDKMISTKGYDRLFEVVAKCGPRPSQAQLDSKDGRLVQFQYSIPAASSTPNPSFS